MQTIKLPRLFWAYLRRHARLIALFAVFSLVFGVVFALYDLPVEAVAYASAICLALGGVAAASGVLELIARPGGFGRGKITAVELQVFYKRLGYLPRGHVQGARAGHGVVRGKVAVVHVLRHLDRACQRRAGGQLPLLRRAREAPGQELVYLSFRLLNKICHLPHRPVPLHLF